MMGLAMAIQQQQNPEPMPVAVTEKLTMVFKAGELFELQWRKRGQAPVCPCGPHGDRPIYSTGLLERAFAAGFDVWVVTSRTRIERYDAWWAQRLPADHIITPPAGHDVALEQAEFEPWVKLAVALRLPHALLPDKDKENVSRNRLDRMAEDWMRRRFSDPAAIREWLHLCGVNFASDMEHPATQRSA